MGTQKKTKEKEREETRLGCTLKVHHNVSIFPDFVSWALILCTQLKAFSSSKLSDLGGIEKISLPTF